jgi:hypothetical protein
MEALAALSAFIGSWFEPLAIETHLGCYDREIFHPAKDAPSPFQMLVIEPRPAGVEIRPMYHSAESRVSALSAEAIEAWLHRALAQSCGDLSRYETTLCELEVRAAWVALPPGWTAGDELLLECYAGTVRVPIVHRADAAWVATAPERFGLPLPIRIALDNIDGSVRFMIHVYWSPWVGELTRPGSPLAEAIMRLEARGWVRATD